MRTTASFLRILVVALLTYFFLDFVGTTGDTSIFIENHFIWLVYGIILLFYIGGEICVESIKSVLYKTLNQEARLKYDTTEAKIKANKFKWIKEKYKKSLDSKTLDEEHEIVLDHNYDGIKELDNNLPPWWVYMFYGTIVFAAVYLIRFEIFNDYNQDEEYEMAVAEAQIEIDAWKKTAKNLVDVNSVTLLTNATDLKAGQNIFNTNCIACHKADGGGGIGPNLTDPYWILGGGIKNVFNTISEGGRDGKGMVSWKSDLKPLEMAQVASYLITFQGTTPEEPKEPEGEIWINPDATNNEIEKEVLDSTKIKTPTVDTSLLNKEDNLSQK